MKFYITLSRNIGELWGKYEGSLSYHEFFDRISYNPKNSGYLGRGGRRVSDIKDATIFNTEDEAHEAADRSRFGREETWEMVINPV